jgi:hypothetical protein
MTKKPNEAKTNMWFIISNYILILLFLLDDVQQYNIEIVAKDKQILMAKKKPQTL